jgi:hypothetical protein
MEKIFALATLALAGAFSASAGVITVTGQIGPNTAISGVQTLIAYNAGTSFFPNIQVFGAAQLDSGNCSAAQPCNVDLNVDFGNAQPSALYVGFVGWYGGGPGSPNIEPQGAFLSTVTGSPQVFVMTDSFINLASQNFDDNFPLRQGTCNTYCQQVTNHANDYDTGNAGYSVLSGVGSENIVSSFLLNEGNISGFDALTAFGGENYSFFMQFPTTGQANLSGTIWDFSTGTSNGTFSFSSTDAPPAPEPATAWLLVMSCGLACVVRRGVARGCESPRDSE